MSYIEKWGEVNRVYSESTRAKTLLKFYSIKSVRRNIHYWFFLGIYFFVSVIALFFHQKYFFSSIAIICTTALLIRPFLEKKLSQDLSKIYDPHLLMQHPISERARYLHFIKFNEKLNEKGIVKPDDVEPLLQWDDIGAEKIDLGVFFRSKIFLIIFTAVIGLIAKAIIGLNLEPKNIFFVVYLIVVFVWLSWLVFDLLTISKNRRLNLRRFLKWYKLENTKYNKKMQPTAESDG